MNHRELGEFGEGATVLVATDESLDPKGGPRPLTASDIEDHGQRRPRPFPFTREQPTEPQPFAARIPVASGEVVESEEVQPGVVFDYDDTGKVVAVELLFASLAKPEADSDKYAPLHDVLIDAYEQAARGKGHDRHSAGKPFLDQPILEIVRMQASIDGHTYQGMKKLQEAGRMLTRKQYSAAVAELYGVINYAAAAVIRIREIETESGPTNTDAE